MLGLGSWIFLGTEYCKAHYGDFLTIFWQENFHLARELNIEKFSV